VFGALTRDIFDEGKLEGREELSFCLTRREEIVSTGTGSTVGVGDT
jgi:hypothetical protein